MLRTKCQERSDFSWIGSTICVSFYGVKFRVQKCAQQRANEFLSNFTENSWVLPRVKPWYLYVKALKSISCQRVSAMLKEFRSHWLEIRNSNTSHIVTRKITAQHNHPRKRLRTQSCLVRYLHPLVKTVCTSPVPSNQKVMGRGLGMSNLCTHRDTRSWMGLVKNLEISFDRADKCLTFAVWFIIGKIQFSTQQTKEAFKVTRAQRDYQLQLANIKLCWLIS